MPRLYYATPEDVVRRFDPTVTPTDLDSNNYISVSDRDTIESRIEGVESTWEREATPQRERAIGRTGWIYLGSRGKGYPIDISLDHDNLIPFDANAGDAIERRTGRDSWTDITADEGSAWVANYRDGELTIYELPGRGHLPALRNFRERFLRLTYRVGRGGEYGMAGETTLASSITTDADQSGVSVADASRLPPEGGVMLVGGEEYIEVTDVDHSADTIDIGSRGERRTGDLDHSSGAVVHYCPIEIREAVASKAAVELAQFENFVDRLVETGEEFGLESKADRWESEWQETLARYSNRYGYR